MDTPGHREECLQGKERQTQRWLRMRPKSTTAQPRLKILSPSASGRHPEAPECALTRFQSKTASPQGTVAPSLTLGWPLGVPCFTSWAGCLVQIHCRAFAGFGGQRDKEGTDNVPLNYPRPTENQHHPTPSLRPGDLACLMGIHRDRLAVPFLPQPSEDDFSLQSPRG